MTFSEGKPALTLSALLLACGGGGGGGGFTVPTGDNVMQITVNGALCDPTTSAGYPDKPCVEVTVCQPGSSTCQTIDDVLLDTASYGLRVFKVALGALSLPMVTSGSGDLAECAQFADNSSDWGPVEVADVVLGGEKAPSVPIHVLDAGYSFLPSSCPNPEATPADAGFNGILGMGVFPQDCGEGCFASADNGLYFSCGASNCTPTAVPIANQVQNPVAMLPSDNNGVIVKLPSVGAAGAASATGYLVLGIGTRANNSLSGLTVFPVDPSDGNFTTQLSGEILGSSFLDTGSNGLFFDAPPGSLLPVCTGEPDWYCPSVPASFRAVNSAYDGSSSATVSFEVGSFTTLTGTSRAVFSDIGGTAVVGSGFDWGLPFYLGRNVAIGMSDSAPFVAYSP